MIEALRSWFNQNRFLLEGEGIAYSLSAGSVGLLKNGISAELKTDHFEVTVELWETGESDFHFLNWEAADQDQDYQPEVVHYDFSNKEALLKALDKLAYRLSPVLA